MEKVYNPNAIETKWYQYWENNGFFKPNGSIGIPYCIMLPPPNVTGSLHMGHAFQDTIMDSLIRLHRMLGYHTLWQGGTDHAGIATQMVVERQLQKNGITRHDLGREGFTAKVWEWKEESGNIISQQMRRLGASLDWSRERFTMDEGLSNAVKEVFVQLYEEGLIYKGKRLVNWDPTLHTAVSDLEVENVEEEGKLYHLRYPLADNSSYLIVATTRPETMLGDVAIAVHPKDNRYQNLIGKQVQLPLTNRLIPIINDEYVDPEFGTGCVKITPAHDFNDYEIGKRHGLTMINIFTPDACLNENAPSSYQGLDRFIAREKIIEELGNLNLIEKIEPHLLKIPRCERTGEIVEPYLTDQWYVKVKPLSIKAVEAVQSGQIRFVPENWSKTFFDWMENIQDWCISRQLWWGHRIPAWQDEAGNIYVARSEEDVRKKYDLSADIILKQEEDVLDTWFSSALWPFSTLGWPDSTSDLTTFYPTQVLVTGFDIIFFWVARMIMMGLKFTGKPPFKTVYVHGLIQDAQGQKMSKSKGNVIDPLDLIDGIDLTSLIEKRTKGLMQPQMAKKIENLTRKQYPDGIPAFGTDALRFTFLAIATNARHIRFDLNKVAGYRNFCNKIWNAARYVFMHVENKTIQSSTSTLPDQWIWSQLQILKKEITEYVEEYRFDLLATSIYEFIWNTYCDWYLEFSKPLLQDETYHSSTCFTLIHVLEELMRILHPFMPYITEEIWQKIQGILQKDTPSIMIQPYPKFEHAKLNESATQAIDWIKIFITALRNIRGEMNIAPSKWIPCFCFSENTKEQQYLQDNFAWIKPLAKISDLQWIDDKHNLVPAATQFAGSLEVFVPLQGLIDVDQETKRLIKEIDKHTKDLQRSESKLQNPSYRENAPEAILEEEERRAKDSRTSIAKLQEQLLKLQALQ